MFGKTIHKAVGTASGLGFYLAIPGTIFFIIAGWNVENLPLGSLGYVNIIGLLLIAPISSYAAPIPLLVVPIFEIPAKSSRISSNSL